MVGRWGVLALALVLAGCGSEDTKPDPDAKTESEAASGGGRHQPARSGTLTIENEAELTIFRIRLRATDEEQWGRDRLEESEVLKTGDARSWEVPAASYFVLIEFGDGKSHESAEAYTVSSGEQTVYSVLGSGAAVEIGKLTVVNNTPWAIAQVYFSLNTEMSWGEDRLGSEILAPRQKRTWEVPAGAYNLRIEFQDDTAQETDTPHRVHPGKPTVFTINPP